MYNKPQNFENEDVGNDSSNSKDQAFNGINESFYNPSSIEEYNGERKDGDRVYVDAPLPDILKAESKSLASIIMASLSIALSFFLVGLVLGPLAIINGQAARLVLSSKHHKYHVAQVGVIVGAVGFALSIFFTIYYAIIIILIS